MNQSSEKIHYILQHHFDQGDNTLQACEKFMMFIMKVFYQNQQRANGLSISVL